MTRLKSCAEVAAISWIGSKRLDFNMGSSLSADWRRRRRELRHELLQIRVTTFDSHRFIHVLAQEFEHFRPLFYGQVHPRVRPAPIRSHGDEVAILLISGIHLPEAV